MSKYLQIKGSVSYILIFLICLLLFDITANSQNLSLAWSKALSNPQISLGGGVSGRAIQRDGNGDIYVVGTFSLTADFDPGPGAANLTSVGGSDVFIAKYDANGNYIYARNFGGTGNESAFTLEIDATGNLYMAGGFNGTADFDPGPGIANRTSVDGVGDFFVAKYDADGNYIFANATGSSGYDEATSLKFDGNGNTYVTGYFGGVADFDPGPAVVTLGSVGVSNIFIVKYDINGDYVFAKQIGGGEGNALELDGSGNIFITGKYRGTVDFDPGPAVVNLTSAGTSDVFFAKYDTNGNYQFAKSVGGTANAENAYAILVDGAGKIYLSGTFSNTADFDPGPGVVNLTCSFASDDLFLAGYDINGNYLFAVNMGGNNSDNEGRHLLEDGSGNICVLGLFSQTVDFDPGPGVANLTSGGLTDFFIAKYDINGNYIYARGIGTSTSDYGWDFCADGSGNMFVTGNFSGTVDFDPGAGVSNLTAGAGSTSNAYLASYASDGNFRYVGMMGGYSAYLLPDIGYDVALDGSGNVYITGSFTGTVDFDPGPGLVNLTSTLVNTADIFIAKYDASGNYLYAKQLGGISADNSYSFFVDATGNVYITGTFSGTADFDPGPGVVNLVGAGSTDIFIAKYDINGDYVYAKGIGGSSADYGASLSVDGSGNVYVTGYYQGTVDFNPAAGVNNLISAGGTDIFIAKYDASGNYVYAKSIGGAGADFGVSLAIDGTGNVFATGRFSGTADFNPAAGVVNLVSAGGTDIFIAKYDVSGNYVYAKRMGGTTDDYGNSLVVDGSGNIYLTGYYQATADFDPGAGTVNLVSAGGADTYIAKYDASGNYVYAKSMGGTGNDMGYKLSLDGGGNIFFTGTFSSTADFDPGAGVVNLISTGGADIFIAKYDAAGNYIYAKSMGGTTVDNGNSFRLDGGGNIYVTGSFTGTADFDPNANTQTQTAWNSSDIYLVKLTECVVPGVATRSTPALTATISGATQITDGGCSLLASILPNGGNPISGAVNAKVWIESSVPTFGGEAFVERHYEITPTTSASTSTAKVTLYFTQQEFDNFNAHVSSVLDLPANPTDVIGIDNLRIGKYPGTSNNGTGLPGSYFSPPIILNPDDTDIIWNSSYNRWEVSFDVNGFSGFIIQTSNLVLPLTLLEFNGRLVNNSTLLTWKTTNEVNTYSFEVERSIDGRNYTAIGQVLAYNTAGDHQYNFTDNNMGSLTAPVIYYRLKQKDISGRFSYSRIVALSIDDSKPLVLLYPNPVIHEANLTISINKPERLLGRIIDNTGRAVKQLQWNLSSGSTTLTVDIRALAKGVYYLELKGEQVNERMQFIKQ